jgi:hypothetical protein
MFLGQIDVHCGSGSTTGLFSTLLPVLAGIAGTGIGAGVTLYTSRVSNKNSREREAEERQFRQDAEERNKREQRLRELYESAGLFSTHLTTSLLEFGKLAERDELTERQKRRDELINILGDRALFLRVQFLIGPGITHAHAAFANVQHAHDLYVARINDCLHGVDRPRLDAIYSSGVVLSDSLRDLLSAIWEEEHGASASIPVGQPSPATT